MALYDDPKKKRPLTALEQQAAATQAGYGASVDRMQTAQKQATGIQIPMPIIQEGRGSFKSIARPGQDAAVTALGALGGVARQEQAKQAAMIPTFNQQAAGLRAQAGSDRATAANLGANKLLAGVGAAPIAAPVAAPRPAAAPPQAAAIASPGVRFAGIDAAPDNFYRNPPGTQPRNAAELDQASKAEVAARNQAPRPGTSLGAGASTTAGAGAPNMAKTVGKFGETVFSNVGSQYGTPATTGTIGSVNTQNFGNPVVPQAPGSIARPGVASTFGLGVNDPRMNDAIARPQVQLGPNQTNGFGTLRGPDQMAEQYNSREDREARQATNGNIDTALFMARGKPGSEAAIANLLETKARLNSGAEGLSQEAIQNRGQRDNQFDIAGMEQAGQTQRQQMAGDVTREGNLLDFNAKNRETDASLIEKPQYITDDQRRYLRVGPDGAAPVTDAAGNVIQMPQTQQAQITPDAILKSLDSQEKAITDQLFNAPPEAAASLQERLKSVSAQREQLLRGGGQPQQAKPPAGYPNAKQAPDGKWYVKKDGATYLVN